MILSNAIFLLDEYDRAVAQPAGLTVAPAVPVNADLQQSYEIGYRHGLTEPRVGYEMAMGEAAQKYFETFKHANPLPAQFRWSDVYDAMIQASITVSAQPMEQSAPCIHADNPKACYRVRCQLGNKCVDDDISPRGSFEAEWERIGFGDMSDKAQCEHFYNAGRAASPQAGTTQPAPAQAPAVTPAMVKAAMPWLTSLHHMRKADKESNVEEAIKAAIAAAQPASGSKP